MSRLERGARAGFTLLECLVAILILNAAVLGMVRLVSGHHQALDEVDDWSYGDPVYYLVPDPDPMARALGGAAALSVDPPSEVHVPSAQPYEVTVLDTFQDLAPVKSSAIFRMREVED